MVKKKVNDIISGWDNIESSDTVEKKTVKPPKDVDNDIESEMEKLGMAEGIDLTEIETPKTVKKQSRREKASEDAIVDITRKVIGKVGDRFVKGIVAKIDMTISTLCPDEPLTDEEKNSLVLDLNLIISSPEILEKIEKLPMWAGVIMLVISIILIIATRFMSFQSKDKKPTKEIEKNETEDYEYEPVGKPIKSKPKKKKPTNKKRGRK